VPSKKWCKLARGVKAKCKKQNTTRAVCTKTRTNCFSGCSLLVEEWSGTAGFSKMVPLYQAAWYHIKENHNLKIHCSEKLISHTCVLYLLKHDTRISYTCSAEKQEVIL
jgi:hypothetical protein